MYIFPIIQYLDPFSFSLRVSNRQGSRNKEGENKCLGAK